MNILIVIIIVNVYWFQERESFRCCGIEDVNSFLDSNVLINIKSFKKVKYISKNRQPILKLTRMIGKVAMMECKNKSYFVFYERNVHVCNNI